MLLGHQPSSRLTALELCCIPHRCHYGARCDRANTRNGFQSLTGFALLVPKLDLQFQRTHLAMQSVTCRTYPLLDLHLEGNPMANLLVVANKRLQESSIRETPLFISRRAHACLNLSLKILTQLRITEQSSQETT